MNNISKKRLVVFDFIRLFAILMVVLSHTILVGDVPIDILYLGVLGNVIFFFISGYLIYLNNNSIESKKDILHFYKKRVLRIYPLYIIAVITLIIVSLLISGTIKYSIVDIIASIFGLQMVFYPNFVVEPLILWFIGMILIFYIIYPIVIYLSRQKLFRYLLYSCLAIGILVIIKVLTGFIGGGVFEYYFVFVAGVLCAWVNIFKSRYIKPISVISFIIFGICLAVTQIFHPMIGDTEHISLNMSVVVSVGCVIFLRIIYGISAVFVLYTIYNWIKPKKLFLDIILKGAFASYAVYLFHGQFFTVVNKVLLDNNTVVADVLSNPLVYDILLVCVLIPIIFVIAYFIQKGENICINKLKNRTKTTT